MKYLLDTHTWLWLMNEPEKLSSTARKVMKSVENTPFGLADISCWEVARKESLGKLTLTISSRVWLQRATTFPGIRLLHLTPDIAWESCHLPPPFHRDPADQIIVASARILDLTVITRDQNILEYPHVNSLKA